ncbi:glutaredoxin [Granulicella mallensis]|jgi:hypothetical protein|uniref:Glutaredoxin n=1 Tax=Granulicella mallensis TaxID=940614 RepID=A0A7W8E8N3_9BACT|nr:glutaredoxin [Granulicella mallensis]
MTKYVYLVLDCKNPKCRTVDLLKYHGVYEGQLEIGEMFPEGFSWGCGQCHQTYRYLQEETRLALLDFPPPKEWKEAAF